MADVATISVWEALEWVANFFYDPEFFWGAPLLLAVLWAVYRRQSRAR